MNYDESQLKRDLMTQKENLQRRLEERKRSKRAASTPLLPGLSSRPSGLQTTSADSAAAPLQESLKHRAANPSAVQSLVMQENFFTASLEESGLDPTEPPRPFGMARELSICPEEESEGESGHASEELLNGMISEQQRELLAALERLTREKEERIAATKAEFDAKIAQVADDPSFEDEVERATALQRLELIRENALETVVEEVELAKKEASARILSQSMKKSHSVAGTPVKKKATARDGAPKDRGMLMEALYAKDKEVSFAQGIKS